MYKKFYLAFFKFFDKFKKFFSVTNCFADLTYNGI